jgi:hypothetical protein
MEMTKMASGEILRHCVTNYRRGRRNKKENKIKFNGVSERLLKKSSNSSKRKGEVTTEECTGNKVVGIKTNATDRKMNDSWEAYTEKLQKQLYSY